jgi:predicted HicB family RNase H-like nuclease
MATKVAVKNDRYTYRVTWSDEDQEYVGLCAEFPSLSWLAGSQEEALQGIRDVVAEVIVDMKSHKEPVPEPIAARRYSGKFTVRVTPDVHRQLAIQAAEAKVSINRLISGKLTTV